MKQLCEAPGQGIVRQKMLSVCDHMILSLWEIAETGIYVALIYVNKHVT